MRDGETKTLYDDRADLAQRVSAFDIVGIRL